MPTYDYECDACSHTFELYQGINDSVKKKCPECGKPKLRRLLGTGAAVVFKGSGFYQTDYRSDSYKKAQSAEKPAAADSSSASGGNSKSEGTSGSTKPAETTTPKSTDGKKPKKSSE